MMKHMTTTREKWLAARLDLLEAEKELTRQSDALAERRQELPWVRVDKTYRFETEEGSATLPDLFRGRSQLPRLSLHVRARLQGRLPVLLGHRDGFDGFAIHLANHDVTLMAVVAGAARQAAGLQAANGLEVSLGLLAWRRLQFRLQRFLLRGAAAPGSDRIQTTGAAAPRWTRRRRRRRSSSSRPPAGPTRRPIRVTAGHEYVRAGGWRRLSQLFHLCARAGWPLGHVSVARRAPMGPQRSRHLVAPPRRVQEGLNDRAGRRASHVFRAGLPASVPRRLRAAVRRQHRGKPSSGACPCRRWAG